MKATLTRRLSLALAALLLAFGLLVAGVVRHVALQQEEESLQRLSSGLAAHIVGHWPAVRSADESDRAARSELLGMLMTVNPGIQVYLLDAEGLVDHYIGEPGMVRTPRVDLEPVRAFLAGNPLPMRGTDPMGGAARSFSAAMFPPLPGQARPPGYLYIVLPSAGVTPGSEFSQQPLWRGAAWTVAAGGLATLLLGAWVLRQFTRPLTKLVQRMQAWDIHSMPPPAGGGPAAAPRHEVDAIAQSFDSLSQRVAEQVQARAEQEAAHRDVMANVAHDLRTPLTALHGHLEALNDDALAAAPARRNQLLTAALSQSDKVRRLSQQLFELATLQSTDDLPQRERFRLDELVADTVQKFHPGVPQQAVALAGPAPAAVLLDGDLHLIERALSNLIDNAVRHAPGLHPVQVSLDSDGTQARVLVADTGPGLPIELARRLEAGQPVREPALSRPGGGVGGLGLAIAQRIALLHGGSLRVQAGPGPGTRLVLSLPLAGRAAAEH
jgi:signal transduction histidine kinase